MHSLSAHQIGARPKLWKMNRQNPMNPLNKKLAHWLLLTLWSTVLPLVAQSQTSEVEMRWGKPTCDHIMSIMTSNSTIAVGSPVQIIGAVKYIGTDNTLYAHRLLFYYDYQFKVILNGTNVPTTEYFKIRSESSPGSINFQPLVPNKEYNFKEEIGRFYVMNQPGEYHVSGTWQFKCSDNWTNCISNEIIFTVK